MKTIIIFDNKKYTIGVITGYKKEEVGYSIKIDRCDTINSHTINKAIKKIQKAIKYHKRRINNEKR